MAHILCANGKTKHRNAMTAKKCPICRAASNGREAKRGATTSEALRPYRFDVPGGGSGECNTGTVGGEPYTRDTDGEGYVGPSDLVVRNNPTLRSRGEGTMHVSMSELDGCTITCQGDPAAASNYCSVSDSLVKSDMTLHNSSFHDSTILRGNNASADLNNAQVSNTTFTNDGVKKVKQVNMKDSKISGGVEVSAVDQYGDDDYLDEEERGSINDAYLAGNGRAVLGKNSQVTSSMVALQNGAELHTGNRVNLVNSELKVPNGAKAYIASPWVANDVVEATVAGVNSDGVAIVAHRLTDGSPLKDSWGNTYRDDGYVYLQERGAIHAFEPTADGKCAYRYTRSSLDNLADAPHERRERYERMAGDYSRQVRYDRGGIGGAKHT